MFTAFHQVLKSTSNIGYGWYGPKNLTSSYLGIIPMQTGPEIRLTLFSGFGSPGAYQLGQLNYAAPTIINTPDRPTFGTGAGSGAWIRADSLQLFRNSPEGQFAWEVKLEQMAQLPSGFILEGDVLDQWLPLNVDRTWKLTTINIPFAKTAHLKIQIRNGSSALVVAEAILQWTLQTSISSGT